MKQKAIIVTGCAGLIGSKLVEWLLIEQPNYDIIGIDDLSGGIQDFIHPDCIFYQRDCGTNLDDIFEKYDVKIIYHCAAIASESLSNFRRKFYYQSNIVNSANLINYSIKYDIDRFVFFSSMAVYGNNPAPFVESQIPAPIDSYGIGKYCIEMDLECAKNQHGLKYTIVRPHSVYGPNQNITDQTRNVICIWMRQIMNDEPVSIYGDGLQKRAFTFIDDCMEPLWKCATEESTLHETFNIGNDQEMTIMEALATLKDVTATYFNEVVRYPAIHEVKLAFSDHKKAREVLGLECKTPLKEGLKKMWEWAQKQPKRELKTFDEFELEVGLYEQFKKNK